jgi:phosphate transport system substrate-binding protein
MNTKRTLLKTVAAAAFASIAMGSALAADITGAGAHQPLATLAALAGRWPRFTGLFCGLHVEFFRVGTHRAPFCKHKR